MIAPLMGGTPAEQPARYRDGSPQEILPLGVPQHLVAAAVLSPDDAVRFRRAPAPLGIVSLSSR